MEGYTRWNTIPQQPQRQDSLDDQLRDVAEAAKRLGCYDAADWIRERRLKKGSEVEQRVYVDGKHNGDMREGEWHHVQTVNGPSLTRWQQLFGWVQRVVAR